MLEVFVLSSMSPSLKLAAVALGLGKALGILAACLMFSNVRVAAVLTAGYAGLVLTSIFVTIKEVRFANESGLVVGSDDGVPT